MLDLELGWSHLTPVKDKNGDTLDLLVRPVAGIGVGRFAELDEEMQQLLLAYRNLKLSPEVDQPKPAGLRRLSGMVNQATGGPRGSRGRGGDRGPRGVGR